MNAKIQTENLNKLRQMLNQEVNNIMFNPDVRDHTPEEIVIIIKNSDGHVHCIHPDDEITKLMIRSAYNGLSRVII